MAAKTTKSNTGKAAPSKSTGAKAAGATTKAPDTAKPKLEVADAPAVASVAAAIAPKAKVALKAVEAKPEALKRRALLESVAARAGVKRTDVREVMDAVLIEMAEALEQGRDLILPPFGKVMLRKDKDGRDGRPMVARIKLIEAEKRGSGADQKDDH